jgi:hypothetical protein
VPTSLYAGNPTVGASGRPQPQTADYATAGPFIRHARPASRPGYVTTITGGAAGPVTLPQTITLPLASAPGYLRRLDLTWALAAGTTTAAVFQADGPFNVAAFVTVKDAWGTPLLAGGGYEIQYLVPKFSGQLWLSQQADITDLPSFSNVAGATGAFTFRTGLVLEATKGYCVVSIGNASVLPTLSINTNGLATVLGGTLTTPGALTLTVDEPYYDVDPAMPVEPLGLGSTVQWTVVNGNQTIAASSVSRVQLPRTGGYLTTLIIEIRDSTGARNDVYVNGAGRLKLYIDGVPYADESYLEVIDRMSGQFLFSAPGITYTGGQLGNLRPNGVYAYTFKDSMSQASLGLADTLESVLLTNPGTLLEVEGVAWGAGTNSPATLTAVVGQLVPTGPIQQGLIEA